MPSIVGAGQVARQLPILLFISFDGFRHDYLNPSLTPNLFALSKEATVGHMKSCYVTKTFPNHFSMVTGLYEDEHQMINNHMFDPRLNQTFDAGDTDPIWWDFNENHIPIWIANEILKPENNELTLNQHQRFSGSMMYPGSETRYSKDSRLPTHLKKFDKVRDWYGNIDTVISWLIDPEKPANLVTIYFDDPDSTAHKFGPWGNKTLKALRRVDDAAGYLLKRLVESGLSSRTNIIFVSDHGMAEVNQVLYLSDVMNTTYFDMYGSSPDWSIFVKPEYSHLKDNIFESLQVLSTKYHFKIYKREDIPPEHHYSKSPRIGDFFMLVDRKFDIFKIRNSKKMYTIPKVWGNHGWDPSDDDMRPLFMAYGPAFKSNYYHSSPFTNIDLFPLMAYLLDLPLNELPNNGSLANIYDIIDIGGVPIDSIRCKFQTRVKQIPDRRHQPFDIPLTFRA